MSNFLIFFVVLFYSLQTLFCTLYTKKYNKGEEFASSVFQVYQGFLVGFVTLIFIKFQFKVSLFTWIVGILNALMLFIYNTSMIKAGKIGSYAFMNISYLFGDVAIPIFYNTLILGNIISPIKYAAIFVMVIAFVLINIEDIKLKDTPKIYYLFCFLLFLSNGLFVTFLKVQSVHFEGSGIDESNKMIIITYVITAIVSLISLLSKKDKKALNSLKVNKQAAIPLVLCVLATAIATNVLVYIIKLIDITILYTVSDGGVLVLSAIFSVILFKEKITPIKSIGMLIALASIVTLSV